MGRTVIVGAGIIGLACAWELVKRGEDVVVLDQYEPGMAASKGNAGWITPSISTPLPAPGVLGDGLKWMLRSDSPLYIKPRANPRFAMWMRDFMKNCNPEAYRRGNLAMADLNKLTMPGFDQWMADGIDFEMHNAGLLFLGFDDHALEHLEADKELLELIGYKIPKPLTGAEIRDMEPNIGKDVQVGWFVEEERHVRPEKLIGGLVSKLKDNGIEIRSGVKVLGGKRTGRRISEVETSSGSVAADKVLIAAGAWTGAVSQTMGLDLPIEAGKGYSITAEGVEPKVSRSLYLVDARVAATPFDNGFRLAGTMELSGLNTKMLRSRIEAIRRAGERFLGDWAGNAVQNEWVGMRPLTPDGIPVMGMIPQSDNLYVAGGHQMLGITLGPATGQVMAELMTGADPEVAMAPFNPGRFKGGTLGRG